MKFDGTKPSGKDNDVEVYVFTLGVQELRVMVAALSKVRANTLKLTETEQIRNRLSNMIKTIGKVLEQRKQHE